MSEQEIAKLAFVTGMLNRGWLGGGRLAKAVGGAAAKILPRDRAQRIRLAVSRAEDRAWRRSRAKFLRAKRRANIVQIRLEARRAGKGRKIDRSKRQSDIADGKKKKKGSKFMRNVIIGGGLMGTGAVIAGGAAGGVAEAKRDLAPPQYAPPGY